MKVGDLVRIAPYCQNKGKLAIVTYVPSYKGEVRIRYLEPTQSAEGYDLAYTSNLISVSGK
jgi:hypothetical protein